MSNVKLAIRVRPFTDKELKSDKERIPVVNVVDEHTVTITNVKVSPSGAGDSRERVRRYSADYTFDSSCPPTDDNYASQEKVFESIGREVLSSASVGASACVLAYGQSATGKTHTMMGTEEQPGLIPRLCRAFAEHKLDLTVSFLEIYNERVHDLLAGESLACQSLPRRRGNARKDLRVREHPERGPYVQNLRRVAVTDVETLLALVEEGARRRRTAATRRNSTSSRSHALLELATAKATLHLADLAGSEKASWEGCGAGQQKEGANINKSLVALSNVISALVSGGRLGRFVPYRDSALTWLLKDCFTGGARTFIIATVSPSVACYGESASTLRWAERARQLRKPRTLVSSHSTASRADLQAQLSLILAELAKHHIAYNLQTGKIVFDEHHWNSQPENNAKPEEGLSTNAKIGNLLNMFNPKTELQNSESTASSVASSSSDVINVIDKNIKEEITKEVDKILTPAFERTRSGSEIEMTAPLRHRRRQYKSQEVLPIDKTLQVSHNTAELTPSESQEDISQVKGIDKVKHAVPILYDNQRAEIVASVTERLYSKLKKKEETAVSKVENIVDKKIMEPLSELRICTNARQRLMEISQKAMRNKGRRIGIPAYTQTKYTVTRVRDQGVDVQSDLETYILRKDCSFTLQRDVATETIPMTPRCKEIAVGPKSSSLNYHDRGTSTEVNRAVHRNAFMMTDLVVKSDGCSQTPIKPPPRRKRRAVTHSKFNDSHRCCLEEFSATPVISINISQPYQMDSETLSSDDNIECHSSKNNLEERLEEELEQRPFSDRIGFREERPVIYSSNVSTTPDLLTNHNNIDTSAHEVSGSDSFSSSENNEYKINENSCINEINLAFSSNSKNEDKIAINSVNFLSSNGKTKNESITKIPQVKTTNNDKVDVINQELLLPNICNNLDEFPEEISLPRVTVTSVRAINQEEIKDMILGRNDNMYPYNIILSPPREREDTKRVVKFKDSDEKFTVLSNFEMDRELSKHGNILKSESSDVTTNSDGNISNKTSTATCSDSTDSSQVETNSFIWKQGTKTNLRKGYTPVCKSNSTKYKNARTKAYKEFLGLNIDSTNANKCMEYRANATFKDCNGVGTDSESTDIDESQNQFRQRREYFEEKFKRIPDINRKFHIAERKLLASCDSLNTAVGKYEGYLINYGDKIGNNTKQGPTRTPKEYLKHLIELRREFVRTEYDTTDSSIGISRK